jgi:HPt (histidine-containing phosphotransfer) domain-containing protein
MTVTSISVDQFQLNQFPNGGDVVGAVSMVAMHTEAHVREDVHVERRINGPREQGPKPVDMTYLHRFTAGDRGLEREVLYLFAQSAPVYIENMRAATDAKAWIAAAHTLKGSARAVGAWRVARAAELAEKISIDADLDRRAFLIDTAEEAADEAIGYIVQIFPET